MKVYISGISGTGMGPLALMAKAAGMTVVGSDLAEGAVYEELREAGTEVSIGAQDGEFLRKNLEGLDWFVYTSALPKDHPELLLAKKAGVKVSKRDEFTAFLVEKLGLKMVAVAGTHGKTTTTAMIVFAALKLGLPASYIVGTTLGFAPSGSYKAGDRFFIYEADEYDRNFLQFSPWLAVLPFVSYDHPDIYKTPEEYLAAFREFLSKSEQAIFSEQAAEKLGVENSEIVRKKEGDDFLLAGKVRRENAALARKTILEMSNVSREKVTEVLNEFPGAGRRFEKIAEGVYSDYAHHPEEIKATLEMAAEEAKLKNSRGVVAVYQPHQNTRQHEVHKDYKDAFLKAEKIFWLPTYLTRENSELEILTPEFLIKELENAKKAEPAEADDALAEKLKKYLDENYLILLMTAGPADGWLRKTFKKLK